MHDRLFDHHCFIRDIARVSRNDGRMPDPDLGIGCECYAFSVEESNAHSVAQDYVRKILHRYVEGRDFGIEKDAIGNVFATLYGTDRSLAAFTVISHLDTVANGGMFDGRAGVAMALSILDRLARSPVKYPRSYRVGILASEESSPRNGVGCLGSSIATGTISVNTLRTVNHDGKSRLCEIFTEDRWKEIEDLVRNPSISPQNTFAGFEGHIEQGRVIAKKGCRVGIVTGAMGGAWREKIVSHPVQVGRIHSRSNSRRIFRLEFRGVSDHTGNTPPNSTYQRGCELNRKDALVASSHLAVSLLRDPCIELLRSETYADTGYTSIPCRHIVELLVPEMRSLVFERRLRQGKRLMLERYGVSLSYRSRSNGRSAVDVVSREMAWRYLAIAPVVSILSMRAFRGQGTELGKTRATVVDYHLTPTHLSFKFDGREVDRIEGENLWEDIRQYWHRLLGENFETTNVSRKLSQPIDKKLAAKLEKVVQGLGISYVNLPSLAGHDTDRYIEAGIPMAMLFFRQEDGISHSPYERLEKTDLDIGIEVGRAFTVEMLKE